MFESLSRAAPLSDSGCSRGAADPRIVRNPGGELTEKGRYTP
jgi:hypothetical protein